MTANEILALYLSGDIYNANALTDNRLLLIKLNAAVVLQARALLAIYTERTLDHTHEYKVQVFNDYVNMLSISSYLDFRIRKLEGGEIR